MAMFVMATSGKIYGQPRYTDATNAIDDRLVAAITATNYDPKVNLQGLLADSHTQRQQIIQALLKVLNEPKSSNWAKRYAAYYLGQIHAVEAIDSLAAQITLRPPYPIGGSLAFRESEFNGSPAFSALIHIGNASIPDLIRNLAESDDIETKRLSILAIFQIDGDKDISQLRLQKTLKAETNSQRQARLQEALKALAEI